MVAITMHGPFIGASLIEHLLRFALWLAGSMYQLLRIITVITCVPCYVSAGHI